MKELLEKFDLTDFWESCDYSKKEYEGNSITPLMIKKVVDSLGYKLPESYIYLLQNQNGGIPQKCNYPLSDSKSFSGDYIAISAIHGIDEMKNYSLLGSSGSNFMKEEWGYPDIGIYICDCPSAGHDMVALDYRECGKQGEPKVVHVDQELEYKITLLADDFETFITGLVQDEEIENQDLPNLEILWKPKNISFEIKKNIDNNIVLNLKQTLLTNESGWTQIELTIPSKWEKVKLKLKKGQIRIKTKNDIYYVNKENAGIISFHILDAGCSTDSELERIWNEFGK